MTQKDDDPNDGEATAPVISISIGNSCDFGYKFEDNVQKVVTLNSGDVVLFGGANRMLLHSVLKVHLGTSPDFLHMGEGKVQFHVQVSQITSLDLSINTKISKKRIKSSKFDQNKPFDL